MGLVHDFAGDSSVEKISAPLSGYALDKAGAIGDHAWEKTGQNMRESLHHLYTDAQIARRMAKRQD